ncbi:hypothetical protein NDU88_009226 [Pleurodeles waltl]|uniref:Uncharacterized protein n=1 Tax=Pleurodeles waltl TaxID=8319 RepID=A0AAV7PUB9_PLEWA|nr:hypothetical protein NDU88_009226 [Pleurodeles waltl]
MHAILGCTKEDGADEERRSEEKRTRSRRPGEHEDGDQGEGGYAVADCQTEVPARDLESGTSGAGGSQRKLRSRLGKSMATSGYTIQPRGQGKEARQGGILPKEVYDLGIINENDKTIRESRSWVKGNKEELQAQTDTLKKRSG